MGKFGHLFVLSALLSVFVLVLPTTSQESASVTPLSDTQNATGITTDSITSSSNSTQFNATNTTPSSHISENSTSPQSHTTTNNSTDATPTNLPAPSPTTQTENTTSQIAPSASATSLTTQHTSEHTTASVSLASTTFSVPVATGHGNVSTSSTTATNVTGTTLSNNTHSIIEGDGLKHSEKSMTILFSVILGVIVLIVLGQFVYKVGRNKYRRQYSHRPLHEEDTGEQFIVPDDTLVISGGLYDGSHIYNPTMSVLHDEEQPTFLYRPSQFRLEFLSENQGTDLNYEAPTCETFKPDQHP